MTKRDIAQLRKQGAASAAAKRFKQDDLFKKEGLVSISQLATMRNEARNVVNKDGKKKILIKDDLAQE